MAAVAEVVVGELFKNIISILQQNIRLFKGVEKDAEKLSNTLLAVQAVLEDAEGTQLNNKSIRDWLRKLKDATYDAEDILEDLSLEEAQRREQEEEVATHRSGCTSQVSHSVSTCFDFNNIKFRHKIAKKLKSILGRFDEIAEERVQSQFQPSDLVPSQTESCSDLREPTIYGRDEDIEKVIAMLLHKDHSKTKNVFILPIVGLGGIGKTTLAQLVYNNERVVSFFEKRIWVCVSDSFDVKSILKQILESLGVRNNSESLDSIEREVVKSLEDKKYLLVLDDVWNNDKDKWNELRCSLTSGASGSSIMVTTRSTRVASITSSTPPYNLEGAVESTALRLSYNCLPSRLKQCFFHCSIYPKDSQLNRIKLIYVWMANGFIQSQGRLELEDVGEDIFHELLQLSIFQDTKEDDYGNIKTCKMHDLMHDLACSVTVDECLIAEVGRVKDVVKTIRHLTVVSDSERSSTVLDPVISSKPSFRTLFFFHQIDFQRFKFSPTLRALNLRGMDLTTLPNSICQLKHLRYLDLSENSLESLPEFICRLRNLQMLDLSGNGGLTTLPLSIGTFQHLRYLSLSETSIGLAPESIVRLSNLENLRYLYLSGCKLSTSLCDFTGKLRNLQGLNLSYNEITSLPDSIGNMESLRYLDLSNCKCIRSLPESVGDLRNLQSLILLGCSSLEKLPKIMLPYLRHLDLKGTLNLIQKPDGLRFVVGEDSRYVDIKELQGLKEVTGWLEIKGLKNFRNAEDAKEAKLNRYLEELSLSWWEGVFESSSSNINSNSNSKEVLEGVLLQTPPNLKKLGIYGYPGAGAVCFPRDLNNSLVMLVIYSCPNLTSLSEGLQYLTSLKTLHIKDCVELELETDDGFQHLTSLSHVLLYALPKLRALPQSFQHLTSLKSLTIEACKNLTRLLPGMEYLTSLHTLTIEACKNLGSLSEGLKYLSSLDTLTISECWGLKLERGDFRDLKSLRQLYLRWLPKLTALPSPQHLTMLQSLEIIDCENLKRLPDGIHHLTTLRYLDIYNCHEDLHTRCEKENGDNRHLIFHIPHITLGEREGRARARRGEATQLASFAVDIARHLNRSGVRG